MSALLLESEDVAWFRDDLSAATAAASRLARRIGMSEHRAAEVALAVSEATTNLAKHAVAGTIALRIVRTDGYAGLEFLAMDRGLRHRHPNTLRPTPRPACAHPPPEPVRRGQSW